MRKEQVITIANGRDAGKRFKLVEMGAYQTEAWLTRALLVLMSGNAELKDDDNGLAGLAKIANQGLSLLSKVEYAKAKPLIDDLMACCYYLPEKTDTQVQLTPNNIDSIVEDVKTLFELKKAVFGLHFDFFQKGDLIK